MSQLLPLLMHNQMASVAGGKVTPGGGEQVCTRESCCMSKSLEGSWEYSHLLNSHLQCFFPEPEGES